MHIAGPLLFVFFLTFAGPGPAPVFSEDAEPTIPVYQILPEGKSLLTSLQFLVIDDFNSGKFTNRRGAAWSVKAPAGGGLDLALDKVDGRNMHRGYSMQVKFNLVPGEEASLRSFLNRLDVSQTRFLIFRCRFKTQSGRFPGRFRISLTDWRHESVVQDVTSKLEVPGDKWQDMILPMSLFRKLDLDQLEQIQFSFLAKGKLQGEAWIDEIAFFADNDAAFESNRDNLAGFPKVVFDHGASEKLKAIRNQKKLLLQIARDTWGYFQNARDRETGLLVDHIRLGDTSLAADYTSPTNIAMDLLAHIAAMDLKIISPEEAERKVGGILKTLKRMRTYKGLFYNFYDTKKLNVTRDYISTVDNGWLAASLVVVRQAFPGPTGAAASEIFNQLRFDEFFDPENHQLVVGFDVPVMNFGQYHYGMLVSEARVASLVAMAKGDVPPTHWWLLFRTPPALWEWQNQKPQGREVEQDGTRYFQGFYKYGDRPFVPSWGGSLFEFLMPSLVIDEANQAPKSLGLNNRIATEIHRDYALKTKGYPVWGISPAAVASGRRWVYQEFGIKALAVKGYSDRKVVTPYASFLALGSLPKDAIANIRNLLKFKIYGSYGFYDSLDLKTDRANPQYLALDQGMILISIANHLKSGSIRERFHNDIIGNEIEQIIGKEIFFND